MFMSGIPTDDLPAVLAAGHADVALAVFSMSSRAADGDDDAYLEWHMLDHLPEQYRVAGVRHGQRWFSTAACRAARAASEPPYDQVDHVVNYLFGGDVDESVRVFFEMGGPTLGPAGRMPISLPRVQVSGWENSARIAAPRVLVGADVIPWRPVRGVYLIIESLGADADDSAALARLVDIPGVAGVWQYRDGHGHHEWLVPREGMRLAVCYLDDDPIAVAERLAGPLAEHWAASGATPELAAPFEEVAPFSWELRRRVGDNV